MPKVLLISTSAPYYAGGKRTGVWLEELSTPYYAFAAAGLDVEMASPAGGPSPIDMYSLTPGFFTDSAKKFLHDAAAMDAFCHQHKLADLDVLQYDAIYLTGGHGTCTDFVGNATLKGCIEAMYKAGKVVAADCHGPIALAECVKPSGEPLVKGLSCTGFSDAEEAANGSTGNVPFLIETKFKELGGKYTSGADWTSHTCVDGKLVTGQNPQSSEACAAKVIELLK